ncbi:MAG: terminase small subunit [Lachnospiraceae bacterium]
MALTKKQKLFVEEYLIDLNATQAAIRAGYSERTSYSMGQRLLKNVEIQNELQERMKQREQRTEITQDRVLQELAKLGFLDIRRFYDDDGKPKDITMLDDSTAACIAGLEVLEEYEGSGDDRRFVGYVKKYKLTDKIKALELIGRHLGMFKDKTEISGDLGLRIQVDYGGSDDGC